MVQGFGYFLAFFDEKMTGQIWSVIGMVAEGPWPEALAARVTFRQVAFSQLEKFCRGRVSTQGYGFPLD